ncbi:MAG: HNH endonuclease [Gemmataceae bacterium]|nr:HNH endonuclease [Gemmataceae bacterium]
MARATNKSVPRIKRVLRYLLAELLVNHPEGIHRDVVKQVVERRCRFPADWHRPIPVDGGSYTVLREQGLDWRRLSQEQLQAVVRTEPKWWNRLRHARRDFEFDASEEGDVWRLSPDGLQGARRLLDASHFSLAERAIIEHVRHPSAREAIPDDETPVAVDDVEGTNRLILLRRGQPQFRQQLIEAYGGRYALTGSDAQDALEAAHIVPASQGGKTVLVNGLLLRADVHTLFDLNLVGINPNTRRACLARQLVDTTPYGEPRDAALASPVCAADTPAEHALRHRWAMFCQANSITGG